MLTPAEELGLGGMNLAGRVRRAFYKLDPPALVGLAQRIRRECEARHVVYMRDGQVETVRILPCPLTVLPDQIGYVSYVTLTIQNALKRLPDIYSEDEDVRDLLQLSAGEERWLADCWTDAHREFCPIFSRLDAVVDFTSPMWKESLKFVEPNLSGIGGLHLAPMCQNIVAEEVFPILQEFDPDLELTVGQDIRELLMREILDHLEAIGRTGRNICFVEPKFASSGIDEQEELAHFYHERLGLRVMHADPAELTTKDGEVFYEGQPIDLAYRDYMVNDLIELEQNGGNIEPMRQLFQQNRMMSSIAAEMDQKNCWEIFTAPEFAQRYFSSDERQVFRRHILWTRMVSDRNTWLPHGQPGDLLAYVRRERERLVLKPNRACGGEGVTLGLVTTAAEWDEKIEQAVREPHKWVVQQLAGIPVQEFPVLDEAEQVHLEPFYVVMGFAPSKYGVGILARASQKQVVNVAQRGGICAVAIGQPSGCLMGPDKLA